MHILSPVTDNCPSRISGEENESKWPGRVSNPGPLVLESEALPTAVRGPVQEMEKNTAPTKYGYEVFSFFLCSIRYMPSAGQFNKFDNLHV